jgi:hypothetical protein
MCPLMQERESAYDEKYKGVKLDKDSLNQWKMM